MLKTSFKTALFFSVLLMACGSTAQPQNYDENIDSLNDANSMVSASVVDFRDVLAQSGISSNQVSFYVQPVNSDTPLLSQNASRTQNPASVIKLVTSYAALSTLGADYRWRTDFLSDGAPDEKGVLSTPLYLKGSGDPQLVIEQIEALVKNLSRSGVKELRAPIVIDRSIFKGEQQDAASFDGEPSMPYNAQPDGALMNFRAISFAFDPAAQSVRMTPQLGNYDFDSQGMSWLAGECPDVGWKARVALSVGATQAVSTGRYYEDCAAQNWHFHAYQMSANDYAQGVFLGLMPVHSLPTASPFCCNTLAQPVCRILDIACGDDNQVVWTSPQVQDGVVPQNARILASVQSPTLANELRDMNHFSNNVMARQVYLSLSAQKNGQGSLDASARVVRETLNQQGLSMSSLVMGNGSGLSRATQISAKDLGLMLVKASKIQPALYDSLPVIGESGTVKNRLKDTDMVGRGRIKTGTLNDVRAIAGYIDGKSGSRYAVVSIIQSARAQTAAGKKIHDAFMQWVGAQ